MCYLSTWPAKQPVASGRGNSSISHSSVHHPVWSASPAGPGVSCVLVSAGICTSTLDTNNYMANEDRYGVAPSSLVKISEQPGTRIGRGWPKNAFSYEVVFLLSLLSFPVLSVAHPLLRRVHTAFRIIIKFKSERVSRNPPVQTPSQKGALRLDLIPRVLSYKSD